MVNPLVFMFSGQGSHYYQMGKELYEKEPVFREWMDQLDAFAKSEIECSIVSYIYKSDKHPADTFDRLLFSHLAIFMTEYALARLLIDQGIMPDYLLGTSLGEFTAAVVADVISCQEAVSILVNQARLFEDHLPLGGMLAVLSDPKLFQNNPILYRHSDLAAVHFDSHFVVSVNQKNLSLVEEFLNGHKVTYHRLPVLYGFHSREIDPVESLFKQIPIKYQYSTPRIPIISCALSKRVAQVDTDYLWKVVREPILFWETVKALGLGKNSVFVDVGPAGTLATYLKYIVEPELHSNIYPILTPFGHDLENIAKLKKNISLNSRSFSIKEKKMKAVVFPGQGSQKKGMGNFLLDKYPDLVAKVDRILGYSIKDLCLNDPQGRLGQTQYTQPALYVVNALTYRKQFEEAGNIPDYVAGHSLGEYNALLAAGVFDFETGLRLVQKRGELMSRTRGGAMAAVVGLNSDQVNAIIRENHLKDISVANYNTPSQIVIAGPRESILQTESLFVSNGAALFIPLNVSGPFHTSFMASAEKEFQEFVEMFHFSPPRIPVISNVYARPYNAQKLKETLTQQITHSVLWTDSIRYLMGKKVTDFVEIGTGSVLTDLIRKIQTEADPLIDEKDVLGSDAQPMEEWSSKAELQPVVFPSEVGSNLNSKSDLHETPPIGEEGPRMITPESLGSREFKKAFNLKYAYVTGSMYLGIASKELVSRISRNGMLAFFGTGGLEVATVENAIFSLKKELNGHAYGMNLLGNPMEDVYVNLFLKHGIKNIEASAYIQVSPALVKYRLKGLKKDASGSVVAENKIIAKISRPEVAAHFLAPAPEPIVRKLLEKNEINPEQAEMSQWVPMADHLCAEADSGGHTDQKAAYALLPAIQRLRDEMMLKYRYQKPICIGAAGGIGTPEAAAAAFVMGADFILTGSINQCTVESGASNAVKDLLQEINVQDTDYAPAGDMFELGSKVQVLRKGVFFPARANKLYALYRQYNSLDDIDTNTKQQIQERYFRRSFSEVYEDVKAYYSKEEIEKAESNPKHKMALIFRWYFGLSSRLAMEGDRDRQVDFQVHCGPSLGAFNQWVKGTELEPWQNRHVDAIAIKLMSETAEFLNRRFFDLRCN